MKRSVSILLFIFVVCSFVFGAEKVSVKPKYRARQDIESKVTWTLTQKEHILSYQWNYVMTPSRVRGGYVNQCSIHTKELELYRGNKNVADGILRYETSLLREKLEASRVFDVDKGLLNKYPDTLPEVKEGLDPKFLFKLLIAMSYVYQHDKTIEVGTPVSAPKEVLSELKSLIGLKLTTDLEYTITGIRKVDRKSPAFGCERGVLFSTSLSWRKDDQGIELRGLAVMDARSGMILGYKAHGWFKTEDLPFQPSNAVFPFTVLVTSDPPGGFEDSRNPSLPALPKMPEDPKPDEKDDTPSADPKKLGKLEIGKDAPAWTLKNLDGKDVSLSDLKGKVVLMHVWASTIPDIEGYMTNMMKTNYDKLKSKGLEIVSVGISHDKDTKEKQKEFVKKNNYDWTFVFDDTGETVNAYQLTSPGFWVLIDKEGKVGEFGSIADPEKLKAINQFLGKNLS